MTNKTIQELYKKVREYDDLLIIPNEVKYSEIHSMRSGIDALVKEINEFNRLVQDKDSHFKLKRLFNNAMRSIVEFIEIRTKENYDYRLELKKKDYVIAKLKEYIDSKDDLDAEIPSDDKEDKKKKDTAPELKGLSKKELELMKSIK